VYPVVVVANFIAAWALAGATFLAHEFSVAGLHRRADACSRPLRRVIAEDHRPVRTQRIPHDHHGDGIGIGLCPPSDV
jgi:hypothetical protein